MMMMMMMMMIIIIIIIIIIITERLVICISEFRCWYSVSMLFSYTTACRSLTARTEHHTLSVYFRQFKKIIIIIIISFEGAS